MLGLVYTNFNFKQTKSFFFFTKTKIIFGFSINREKPHFGFSNLKSENSRALLKFKKACEKHEGWEKKFPFIFQHCDIALAMGKA